MTKSDTAFRTISEVAAELGLAQHILRYWETRFPQLRPLQRAGNRRYYRPADVALARRIDRLLNGEGYTVRGVQKLLADEPGDDAAVPAIAMSPNAVPADAEPATIASPDAITAELRALRDILSLALIEDAVPAA